MTGMKDGIKAIETWHNGRLYRSRLEARWAVFLEVLREPFEYETEGFELQPVPQKDEDILTDPSCLWIDQPLFYVPDFWLPKANQWVEIKPSNGKWGYDDLALEKVRRIEYQTGYQAVVLCGTPGLSNGDIWDPYQGYVSGDCAYIWCECFWCGAIGLQYEGRTDRMACKESTDGRKTGCKRSPHGDKGRNAVTPRLLQAFHIASTHRFDWKSKP